jgi:hypothetical protein
VNHQSIESPQIDLSKFHQLQQQLQGWSFSGQHHMHKSWRFRHAQHALKWHGLAKELSAGHGGDTVYSRCRTGSKAAGLTWADAVLEAKFFTFNL